MTPKILCISLGSIGKRHLKNTRTLLPEADIAVLRRAADGGVPEGANHLFTDMEEARAFGPEAVIVSSPASEHVAHASVFAGEHVPLFIEKPLAARTDQLGDFIGECRSSRGFVFVGYILRFLPALQAIKRALSEGALGEVYTARIEVGQYLPDWRPRTDYRQGVSAQAKLGGGALLELSHELDYATWLFGWPKTILSSTARLSPLEIDVEDSAHLILEYADKRVSVQLDFLQRTANMSVQVVGSKGTLSGDLIREEVRIIRPNDPKEEVLPHEKYPNGNEVYLRQFDFFFHKAFPGKYKAAYPETAGFADWADVDHAAGVLKLVDLAKTASESGTRQTVSVGETQ